MAKLSLAFLGPFRATLGTQPLPGFRTLKVQALLVYLVVEPEPHSRESLMALLWPGLPERSARGNLRQIIYYLRKAIPEVSSKEEAASKRGKDHVPLLIANRSNIQLNPAALVRADTAHFVSYLDCAQNHDHLDLLACHDCRHNLEKAVALYRGNFLEDFYLDDSNEFEEWAQIQREAYRRKALDALEILTTMSMRRKEYPQARDLAERQLEIDDLREAAYRQLMEVMALGGQRSEALAVYERCRRLLVEELGMEPARRTTQLYQQILAGDLSFDTYLPEGIRGYELKDEIGEGAYGVIHRAIQPNVGREVAVKIVRRRYANDPEFIRRFEAEAQTIARLEHPHIVPLYDYWRDPDGAYLVMRYLRGGSLLSALESGAWDPEPTVRLLDQVAGALAIAHRHGVVHRDIKPANILFDDTGNAYLSDFGIAKDLTGEMQMTAEGAVIGTPDYISPEQILNNPVTPQSDIYSLGAVIYEALTGEKPFPDSSVANLIYKHLNEPVPLVTASRPDLQAQIDEVIQRATAKRPVDRYADALEMAEAFRAAVVGIATEPGVFDLPAQADVGQLYNPYKGLRAFQEADADDFFGREALVDQLISHMVDSRFLAVVGPSGSGKSSAVKAGLIPALRQGALSGSEKWFIAEMVPGTHPLEELELALWPVAVDPPPSLVEPMQRDVRGMLRTIRRVLPDEPDGQLLLVIDQFEELFTLVEDEERREFFINSLLAAIRAPRSPLRVVITLRADFYDRPLQVESLGRLLKENTEIILPLSAEELTWATREPARRMGVRLEEGLAEVIVADVTDQPGGLPLMQYALTELFEKRQNGRMTKVVYEKIGGVSGTLGQRAEEIYAGLDPARQEATRQLFLRLVTLGEGVEDTRRRVLRLELEAVDEELLTVNGDQLILNGPQFPHTIDHSQLPSVIDFFGGARLLTFDRDPISREPTVEVAHEALLREWVRLRRWLDESRNDVRLQRILAQATAEWLAAGQEPGYLLRDARLDLFAGWAADSTVTLTGEEQAFLEASNAAREARLADEGARRRRELETAQKLAETERARAEEQTLTTGRLRRRAIFLAGALVVAALLAIAAFFFARQSNQNAAAAEENALLAEQGQSLAITRQAIALAEADRRATAQAQTERERQRADEERDAAQSEAQMRATAEAIAIMEREAAQEQSRLAFSRELAAAALDALAKDQELAVLLAIEALNQAHTQEAEDALHRTVQELRLLRTIEVPGKSAYVDISPDGRRMISSANGGAAVWDMDTGEILQTFDISEGWINRSAFSPDGSLLIMPNEGADSFAESTVSIYDAETLEEILTFVAHDAWVQDVTFSPDGSQFATAGGDGVAKIWDVAATLADGQGQEVQRLPAEETIQWIVEFSPDGNLLATINGHDELRVWDIASGQELWRANSASHVAAFSPDGTRLITGVNEATLDVFDTISGRRLSSILAHSHSINRIMFSPDGTWLASNSHDTTVKIWLFSEDVLSPLMTLTGHKDRSIDLDFSPDGKQLVSTSYDGGTLRIWDISPTGSVEPIHYTHGAGLNDAAISPDGSWLATAGADGTVKIWDVASGAVLHELVGGDWVWQVSFNPDGSLLATTAADATVKLWDVENGRELAEIAGLARQDEMFFFRGVMGVSFSPNGSQLATSGGDGSVRLWDVASLQERNLGLGDELSILAEPVELFYSYDVLFSPDGSWIAATINNYGDEIGNFRTGDGTIMIWDAATGQLVWTLTQGEGRPYTNITFSPDGQRLAAGHLSAGRVTMWRLPEDPGGMPEELFTFDASRDFVSGLSFSPDGSQLAVPHSDGMGIWDAKNGEFVKSLPHPSMTLGAVYSPDGRRLLTAGFDGAGRLFILDVEELITLAQSRLTRSLTAEECQKYLRMDTCPDGS